LSARDRPLAARVARLVASATRPFRPRELQMRHGRADLRAMGVVTKLVPGAVVTALFLVLAAVTAGAALGKPGPDHDDRRGWWPPAPVRKPPPAPAPAPAPVPAPVPVPATPAPAPATTPPGQAQQDAADATVVPPGQAQKDPAAATSPPPGQARKDSAAGAATGTASAPAADAPAEVAPAAPPVLGKSMAVTPVAGTVQVRLPNGKGYIPLGDAGSIPSGTVIDARAGRLDLQTAIAGGRTQTATFWGAVFEIRQARGARGMTDIVLKGGRPAGCPSPAAALGRIASVSLGSGRAAAKAKTSGLWAKDKNGRFRSRGRNSVATVRGTRWSTRETCAGTVTRVMQGAVDVRDLRTGRTVFVRAGHAYLARTSS
jgi:hypothetical protein